MTRRLLSAALLIRCSLACALAQSAFAQNAPPPPPPAPAPADSAKMEALPSADQVFHHYLEATGGSKSHEAITSEMATGTFSMPAQNITGTLSIYQKAPNKMYSVIEIPNVGKIENGSNGSIAWEVSAIQGARIKTPEEAAAAMRQSALDLPENWKKYYKSVEVTGTETIDGKLCYKLALTPLTGSPESEYYEKDSGFLVKLSTISDTPMGKVPTDILFSDYRKQGDVLMPMKNEVQVATQDFVISTEKVTMNPDIPDTRFALPPEIKALQK